MEGTKRKFIGEAINRVDGVLKVTGAANYATDWPIRNIAHAYLVKSTIAAGTITSIDTSAAEKSAGVLAVITYKNAPAVSGTGNLRGGTILQDAKVEFFGQHIGVVVAETLEQARYAAGLVKVEYQKQEPKTNFEKELPAAVVPTNRARADAVRGEFETAFQNGEKKIDVTYETPIEHHQPLEPHSTIAVWEGGNLTVYNGSQIVGAVQGSLAGAFKLKPENVRVITPHIGGGFGSKGGAWGNVIIAAMAARVVSRPVKLALTRQNMFNSVGLRQRNRQHLRIAATKDGKLTALAHETMTHTATTGEFVEPCGFLASFMYDTPNSRITYRVAPMNVIVPTFTRAPGESTGSFALESAIDELAYELKIDPVELRLKNMPKVDLSNGKPFSSRATVAALKRGAEMIGWSKRKMEPRQIRNGDYLIGYGVAAGAYPARQQPTSAIVKLTRNGDDVNASVELAASDLGTGTHTIIAQTAAETFDLPLEKIGVKIGDSSLPPAAGSVGSVGAASFCNAVSEACVQAKNELQAKTNRQWFAEPTIAQLMTAANLTEYQTRVDAKPSPEAQNYSCNAFNANFSEVWVHEPTGMIKIPRHVAVTGAGRIMNAKTARSQIIGGCVWGIGMALTEESILDPRWGNFVTRSFADYHIPVNLDVGTIDVEFILEEDLIVNKLGVKGVGEVGIVGVAAAIANAVFNATGKRIRELPITPDKLL
jgi:xanthine dehydrogenase YagR molybdenum-binding subunit